MNRWLAALAVLVLAGIAACLALLSSLRQDVAFIRNPLSVKTEPITLQQGTKMTQFSTTVTNQAGQSVVVTVTCREGERLADCYQRFQDAVAWAQQH